jgi:hypothetical protein
LAAGPFENEEAYPSHCGIDDLLRVEAPEHPERGETEPLDLGEREAIAVASGVDLSC